MKKSNKSNKNARKLDLLISKLPEGEALNTMEMLCVRGGDGEENGGNGPIITPPPPTHI